MSYLITKLDFPEFVPLSVNVADELINPYIRDAFVFDVEKLLSPAEWALLRATLSTEPLTPAEPIRAVWQELKPLWVCQAFRLFLRWHGTHVTGNGLEAFADVGAVPVSGARRAELIADIDGRVNLYAGRLLAALHQYRGASSTSCSPARRRPRRGGAQTHAL